LNGSKIEAEAIHGNKSQNARQRALNNFKSKRTRVLVATDLASRGIDVDRLSHVINYEIPDQSENYIHRIGRTGRAGLAGVALSFCDMEEREYLRDINKLISIPIPVIKDHPFVSTEVENENYPRKINNSRPSNPETYKKKSARVEVNSMGNEIIHKKIQFGRDRNKSRSYGWSKTRGH
jgi:ATP-dependent RNA helicase RhlE